MTTRKELAQYFAKLGFTRGAEIGVGSGNYSAELCRQNPNLKLYCIDMWDLNPSRYEGFRKRKYDQAVKTLSPYNCELIKSSSADAVKDFEDRSLDFVYLDANHKFNNIMRDLIEWSAKVRRGGIVSGHDYGDGVKDAVDAFTSHHGYSLLITHEPIKSWYFTK